MERKWHVGVFGKIRKWKGKLVGMHPDPLECNLSNLGKKLERKLKEKKSYLERPFYPVLTFILLFSSSSFVDHTSFFLPFVFFSYFLFFFYPFFYFIYFPHFFCIFILFFFLIKCTSCFLNKNIIFLQFLSNKGMKVNLYKPHSLPSYFFSQPNNFFPIFHFSTLNQT